MDEHGKLLEVLHASTPVCDLCNQPPIASEACTALVAVSWLLLQSLTACLACGPKV